MVNPQTIEAFAQARSASIVALRPVRERRRPPEDWEGWLDEIFPTYIAPPFASYHVEFWQWLWSIEEGEPLAPFVAIWPRGYGKSTAVEVGVAAVAARKKRRYALYVSATQEQADRHVQNVAGLLEHPTFAKHYPAASRRRVGKYGNSQGWRRNRVRTASDFTVDAIGLDTAARGAKVDEDRPDLIIFDDVDEILDSPGAVTKNETILTKSLLPSRAPHATVLVAQNLIHDNGIVARLADGRADYLADRIVSGPHPAIQNLQTETIDGRTIITGGESTWPAMTLEDCQREIDDLGISAYRAEKNHDVSLFENGIFGHVTFLRIDPSELPPIEEVEVWVDPAVTDTDKSDSHGIQADGRGVNGKCYRLFSWEGRTSPEDSLRRAILKARELKATRIGVETDQGGDTWRSVYEAAWRRLVEEGLIPAEEPLIAFVEEKAGSVGPKAYRATQMLAAYERGEIIHVSNGTIDTLERALRRYLIRKPFDLVDAAYWGWSGVSSPRVLPMIRGRS